LIKNINATKGTSRNATFLIADFSTALAVVSILSPELIEQGHCQINNNLFAVGAFQEALLTAGGFSFFMMPAGLFMLRG
jgi:hypothetical protein